MDRTPLIQTVARVSGALLAAATLLFGVGCGRLLDHAAVEWLKGKATMKRLSIWMGLLSGTFLIAASACSDSNGPLFGAADTGRLSSPATGVEATATIEAARAGVQITASPAPAGGSTTAAASGSRAGKAAGIEPCRLVTADEAKAAMGGHQPKGAKRTDFDGDPQCLYEAPSSGDVVSIVVDATNQGREAKESHEFIRRTLGYQQVRGVGDAAFIQPGLNMIDAVAGGTRFQIQIAADALPEAEMRATLIELGKSAVSRLP